jgi:HEAT repeats
VAARALGESEDERAGRHLIPALQDQSVTVAVVAVRALLKLGDQRAVLPMYELVQDEATDPWLRRVAAEALVTFGVLRRERKGASPFFLWLLGLLLVVGSVAAAESLGAWALLLFGAGAGALGYYAYRQLGRRQGLDEVYVGPYGERFVVRGGGTTGNPEWLDAFGVDIPGDGGG